MTFKASNPIESAVLFTKNEIGPFKQYNRQQQAQQGSGLGLYLIQTIIEKYHGSLDFDVSNYHTFTIILSIPLI